MIARVINVTFEKSEGEPTTFKYRPQIGEGILAPGPARRAYIKGIKDGFAEEEIDPTTFVDSGVWYETGYREAERWLINNGLKEVN